MKVIEIYSDGIVFEDGSKLYSYHEQDCRESHYLNFEHLKLGDFEGLEFNLKGEFFEKIVDYGIALIPEIGWPVRIPGYGHNSGYYSTDLTLTIQDKYGKATYYDITECQTISG